MLYNLLIAVRITIKARSHVIKNNLINLLYKACIKMTCGKVQNYEGIN